MTDKAREGLDGINERIADCRTYNFGMHNADKLAHEDAARLTRAVEAVLELHVPVMEDGEPVGCSCCDWESEGNWGWPCATLAAIENALNP